MKGTVPLFSSLSLFRSNNRSSGYRPLQGHRQLPNLSRPVRRPDGTIQLPVTELPDRQSKICRPEKRTASMRRDTWCSLSRRPPDTP